MIVKMLFEILYTVIALAGFSYYDFKRFNIKGRANIKAYRAEQWKVQVGIGIIFSVISFFHLGLLFSVLVLINYFGLWWYWWGDMTFMIIGQITNKYPLTDEERKPISYFNHLKKYGTQEFWWTPFGILIFPIIKLYYKDPISWEDYKKIAVPWKVVRSQLLCGLLIIGTINFFYIKSI